MSSQEATRTYDGFRYSQIVAGVVSVFVGNCAILCFGALFVVAWFSNSELPKAPGLVLFFALLLQGLLQWLYVLPLSLWLRQRGRRGLGAGAIGGACLYASLHTYGVWCLMQRAAGI